jgi:uncharacterized protein YggE
VKPRGRPRVFPDEESVQLSVRVTAKQLETAQKQADDARMTVTDWIRRVLARGLADPKPRG